jgi:hypothetical protein
MTYIEESLSPGEKILKITNYHWMYLVGSFINALFFVFLAGLTIFLAIIYHYYDIVKLPPWMIHKAAMELAMSDYIRAFWHTNFLARMGAFMLIFTGLLQIGATMLVRATTEIAVTNRRIVLKRGLISRKVEEMRVDFIEGADVNQTIMGRIFGYGQVKTYGTGTENIFFPVYTADAIGFRRAIQAARNMNMAPQQGGYTGNHPEYQPAPTGYPEHEAGSVQQRQQDMYYDPTQPQSAQTPRY